MRDTACRPPPVVRRRSVAREEGRLGTDHQSSPGSVPIKTRPAPWSTMLLGSSALWSASPACRQREQSGGRRVDGTASVVIVEVDVHILVRAPQVSEAPGPVREAVRP